jgi:asparagine synthetase B (glutamine-hydrolysing)
VFYALDGDVLVVAPSAETAARSRSSVLELDRVAAAAFLARAWLDTKRTYFEGVSRLPQGHLLELRRGSLATRPYWPPEREQSFGDETFEQLARAAVRRLASPRRSVFLSGGIDSALVATIATDEAHALGEEPPVALSIAFRGTSADEEWIQRTIAARLGLEHIISSPKELLDGRGLLESALQLGQGGPSHPTELLTPVYDALARRGAGAGCDLVLTGNGGDEWLMPPAAYPADRLRVLDVPALAEAVAAWHDYWPGGRWLDSLRAVAWHDGARPLGRALAAPWLDRVFPAHLERHRRERVQSSIPALLLPDPELRRQLADAIVGSDPFVPADSLVESERRRLLYGIQHSLVQELNRDFEHRTGIPIGQPLLDADLLGYLYRQPPRNLLEGGKAKALARKVLSRRFGAIAESWPRTVYGNSIWAEAVRQEGPQALLFAGSLESLAEYGLVDPTGVERALNGRDASGFRESTAAWRAVTFAVWLEGKLGGML